METIHIQPHQMEEVQQRAQEQVMALGYFDGLHVGHCRVIETAISEAKKRQLPVAVMSFSPHPKQVLSKGAYQVPHIMSLCAKEHTLEEMGIDTLYIVEFTMDFAALSPALFLEQYVTGLHATHVVAGFDFTYGHKGAGTFYNMHDYLVQAPTMTIVEKVEYEGEKISSTLIRQKLMAGDVAAMPALLGHYYTTRTQWNGFELKKSPLCITPPAGHYHVRVHHENKQCDTVVEVTKEHILFQQTMALDFIGIVHIEWLAYVQAPQLLHYS